MWNGGKINYIKSEIWLYGRKNFELFCYPVPYDFSRRNIVWKRSGSLLNNGAQSKKSVRPCEVANNAMSQWCMDLVLEAFAVSMAVNASQSYGMFREAHTSEFYYKIYILSQIFSRWSIETPALVLNLKYSVKFMYQYRSLRLFCNIKIGTILYYILFLITFY